MARRAPSTITRGSKVPGRARPRGADRDSSPVRVAKTSCADNIARARWVVGVLLWRVGTVHEPCRGLARTVEVGERIFGFRDGVAHEVSIRIGIV
jgi:hypothetical protein